MNISIKRLLFVYSKLSQCNEYCQVILLGLICYLLSVNEFVSHSCLLIVPPCTYSLRPPCLLSITLFLHVLHLFLAVPVRLTSCPATCNDEDSKDNQSRKWAAPICSARLCYSGTSIDLLL